MGVFVADCQGSFFTGEAGLKVLKATPIRHLPCRAVCTHQLLLRTKISAGMCPEAARQTVSQSVPRHQFCTLRRVCCAPHLPSWLPCAAPPGLAAVHLANGTMVPVTCPPDQCPGGALSCNTDAVYW